MKKLIINADDFWMSSVFNKEIISLASDNKISSVSVMMKRGLENQNEDLQTLKEACNKKNISIWLHLDFKEAETDYKDDINNQIDKFKSLFGFSPNHIDIHKDSPSEKCTQEIIEFCDSLNIPFRNRWEKELAKKHTDWLRYVASKKTEKEIDERLSLLDDNKNYEIVFHPWKYDINSTSSLNKERENDVKMIIHINNLLEVMWIKIISFKDI